MHNIKLLYRQQIGPSLPTFEIPSLGVSSSYEQL